MTDTPVHCQRPLWKRPPFWFVVIAAVLALAIGIALEEFSQTGTDALWGISRSA